MPTEYVILRGVNDKGWIEEKRVIAASARAAIRTLNNGIRPDGLDAAITDKGARYVAVPARSWQPVTVTVETKTQLKFQ